MSWDEEIAELARRRDFARAMGGPEGVARQKQRGKLTVRERIDALADPGSFREFMALAGSATYEGGELTGFIPKPQVEGTMTLDGRKVIVKGSDFTVRGGAGGSASGQLGQELPSSERALEWRLPLVRLLDAAGGSVRGFEELGRTYLPDGNVYAAPDVRLLSTVPVVSAVLGSVAGLPAIFAPLSHFSVMVRGISHLFPRRPPCREGGPRLRDHQGRARWRPDPRGHERLHRQSRGIRAGRVPPASDIPELSAVQRR